MKKVLLFLFLINLSLFSQSNEYINELYYAIKYNSAKGISNAVEYLSLYDLDLNNVFSPRVEVHTFGDSSHANASPLIYAIYCGNIEAIDTLLKLGAKLNGLTDITDIFIYVTLENYYEDRKRITTPLMYAAHCSSDEVVSFLIKKGAKVNAKDNNGYTALMYACIGTDYYTTTTSNPGTDYYTTITTSTLNPDIVKSLIRAGANINEVNNGNTALLLAIYTYVSNVEDFNDRIFETIRLLINNGANVNIRNKEGETPLSLSKEFPKLTKFLKDNGAYLQ